MGIPVVPEKYISIMSLLVVFASQRALSTYLKQLQLLIVTYPSSSARHKHYLFNGGRIFRKLACFMMSGVVGSNHFTTLYCFYK